MTRKQYPKEFKLDAVSLVLEQDYSRAEAARSLGINANMLGRWLKEHQAEEGQAFRGNGKLTPEQEEIRKLKTVFEERVDNLDQAISSYLLKSFSTTGIKHIKKCGTAVPQSHDLPYSPRRIPSSFRLKPLFQNKIHRHSPSFLD